MQDDPEIDWARREIDKIDHELLTLMQRRLGYVLKIGERKRLRGLPIFDPAREDALLQRLVASSGAPADAELVRAVFSALVTQCRRIETDHAETAELTPPAP